MVLFLYVNIDQSPIYERIPKSFTPNITKGICFLFWPFSLLRLQPDHLANSFALYTLL